MAVDQRVVTAVTDRRILFTTPAVEAAEVVTLAYEKITSISLVDGDRLELTTAAGIGLEWPLGGETTWTAGTIRHLLWIGRVRSRLRSCRNDIDLAAGEIRTHADRRAWDEATETYQDARVRVDDLCNLVFASEPIDQDALAPELTEIERSLEEARARALVERAQSQVELARQLVENGDYIQGRRVLGQAQEYYAEVQMCGHAIERGDAFQFGTQRDLMEDRQRLGWQIETVAAEPVKQAHEAKIRAETADETAEKIEHWEAAFTRYGHVLTLEWGNDERNFAGDPADLRQEIERAADRLVDLHAVAANDRWNEATEHNENGAHKAALRTCLDAREQYARAHELAAEFEPARAEEIGSRLDEVADAITAMRTAAAPEEEPDDADTPTDSQQFPAASDLAEMDTHHELTLETDEFADQSADSDTQSEHRFEWYTADDQSDTERQTNGNGEQTH